MKLSERLLIDDENGTFTFDGFKFTGDFFAEFLLTPHKPGNWFRVNEVQKPLIVIQTKYEAPPE